MTVEPATVHIIYAEFPEEQPEEQHAFAWLDGRALAPDERAERMSIHEAFVEITSGAAYDDTRVRGERVIRNGGRVLIEYPITVADETPRRMTACAVVSVPRRRRGVRDMTWVEPVADEIVGIMRDNGLAADRYRIARLLATGWTEQRYKEVARGVAKGVKTAAPVAIEAAKQYRTYAENQTRQDKSGTGKAPSPLRRSLGVAALFLLALITFWIYRKVAR
ncbi:hypothetical protein SAMN05421505_11392 [Sinosporangium album]|uniref:Uncharacterized protein n=1 Tax=Sinosporangium album TaxID=504805 RepID=A0A1G8B2A8_9ACTN|nr:hypothetical protein [Sinosporangium album]SDH27173.1 hypothetical protein SAMN05421505_11392 [Sinosporangium album]